MIITFIHSCGVVAAVNNSDHTQPVDCINMPVVCVIHDFSKVDSNVTA